VDKTQITKRPVKKGKGGRLDFRLFQLLCGDGIAEYRAGKHDSLEATERR
jgi:hypothetical protein